MSVNQYEIPRYGGLASTLVGWLNEATQEGDAWLSTQRPAQSWKPLLELLSASNSALGLSKQTQEEYNKLKRIARELVAALGSFRHEGEFKPEHDQALYKRAQALTKIDHAWSRATHAYESHRDMLQYAVSLGTGYGVLTWDKHFHGRFYGNVRLEAFAPDAVTFVQLPNDHDIQRAYAVLIRYELPINLAKAIYAPQNRAFAEALTPDREGPAWIIRGLEKAQAPMGGSPALRTAGRRPGEPNAAIYPVVDVYHAYICDRTVNDTGTQQLLGAHDTNWRYQVPTLGDPISMGIVNPATGQMFTRPAEEDDCRLFPLRRLCIFSRSVEFPCYDGSSPWWHGLAPVVRLRFSDWPWEALGQSLLDDARPMQESIGAIMRAVEDSINARLDPNLAINEKIVPEELGKMIDLRKGGARIKMPLDEGKMFEQLVPKEYYDVPPWITDWVKGLESRMDYLTGVQDLTSIAKAKQLPSSDAMEKLLEMAGPLQQDMIRSVEEPLEMLGEMRKALWFQFMTRSRILQVTGEDGDLEDWVYTPDLLVPEIHGERPDARRDRARQSINEFVYHVSQSGISEINRMTTKLFYLQLMQRGFPLDWWTFNKVAKIPNFGAVPTNPETGKTANTVLERYIAQIHILRELQEEADAGQQKSGVKGRHPSNQAAPRLASKDGGTRSTVKTSR